MRSDEWEGNPYHAHVSSESRDCDGRYSGGYVFRRFNKERTGTQREWDDWLDLYHLLVQDVAMVPDVDKTTIEIKPSKTGGYTFYAAQDTEEGYRCEIAVMCQDPDCDLLEGERFRDHTAESMGY
jgi:hypothetical protein